MEQGSQMPSPSSAWNLFGLDRAELQVASKLDKAIEALAAASQQGRNGTVDGALNTTYDATTALNTTMEVLKEVTVKEAKAIVERVQSLVQQLAMLEESSSEEGVIDGGDAAKSGDVEKQAELVERDEVKESPTEEGEHDAADKEEKQAKDKVVPEGDLPAKDTKDLEDEEKEGKEAKQQLKEAMKVVNESTNATTFNLTDVASKAVQVGSSASSSPCLLPLLLSLPSSTSLLVFPPCHSTHPCFSHPPFSLETFRFRFLPLKSKTIVLHGAVSKCGPGRRLLVKDHILFRGYVPQPPGFQSPLGVQPRVRKTALRRSRGSTVLQQAVGECPLPLQPLPLLSSSHDLHTCNFFSGGLHLSAATVTAFLRHLPPPFACTLSLLPSPPLS